MVSYIGFARGFGRKELKGLGKGPLEITETILFEVSSWMLVLNFYGIPINMMRDWPSCLIYSRPPCQVSGLVWFFCLFLNSALVV